MTETPTDPVSAGETPEEAKRRNRSARLQLIGLVFIFFVPLISAVFLNSDLSDFDPEPTRNHGELLEPVIALPSRQLTSVSGKPVEIGAGGRWTLMTVRQHCETECLEQVDELVQIHRALRKRAGRVAEALVVAEQQDLSGLSERYPHVGLIVNAELVSFLAGQVAGESALYLVDPLGNVMMRYGPGYDPSGLYKDLDRLLKYSKVGLRPSG